MWNAHGSQQSSFKPCNYWTFNVSNVQSIQYMENTVSQLWDDITLLPPPPPPPPTQTGHGVADRAEGVATSDGERAPVCRNCPPQQEKMGETEEERDNVGKLFENFVQASTCKETLQAFNVLCRQLDLDPADSGTFYSSLKERVTTWKAKALWSKLDKRMCHKVYNQGQACVGTKVGCIVVLIISLKNLGEYLLKCYLCCQLFILIWSLFFHLSVTMKYAIDYLRA